MKFPSSFICSSACNTWEASFLRKSLNICGSILNDKAVDLRNAFLKTQIQLLIKSFFFFSRPFYLAQTKLNFQVFRRKIIPHDNVASNNKNTFENLYVGAFANWEDGNGSTVASIISYTVTRSFHHLAHRMFSLQPTSCWRIEGLRNLNKLTL
jgi:hypothetical protein